jgi:ABC-type polysaccharide/polyol phosphate export permease
MPAWLNTFVAYNPLAWQVEAVRGLFEGTPSFDIIVLALAASFVISLILFPIAVYFYKRER